MANENTRQSFVIKHINSNQLVNGAPKLPTADQIEYGEIAINYAKGHETISIKNSQNEIIPLYISEAGKVGKDYQTITYPEPFNTKVSETKVAANDPYDTAFKKVEETISALTQDVLDDESVTTEAIEKLATAAGTITEDDSIEYIVEEKSNYIKNATSVHNATVILDSKLKEVEGQISEGGIEKVNVNGVDGTVVDKKASVTINGSNISIAPSYTKVVYDEPFETKAQHVESTDKVSEAFGKIENTINALVTEVLTDERITAQSVAALGTATGTVDKDGKIVYIKKVNPKFIGEADNVSEAVDILDDKVNDIITSIIKNKIQAAFDAFVAANPGLNNITVE